MKIKFILLSLFILNFLLTGCLNAEQLENQDVFLKTGQQHNLLPDQHTIALYYFEDSTELGRDEMGNWGASFNNVLQAIGEVGAGVELKEDSRIVLGQMIPTQLSEGTIEISIKFEEQFDNKGAYTIIGNDGARVHIVYKNGFLSFQKNHSNRHKYVSGELKAVGGVWYRIRASWGNSGMRLFVNEELLAANNDTSYYEESPRTTDENTLVVGKKSWCCMEPLGVSENLSFVGLVDEIRISSIDRNNY